jgi:Na+-transporting NADH:ubiquinone oxidoreductase subunit A
VYKIKKGLDLPISGVPSSELEDSSKISTVAVLGSDYNGLKPTMLVKVGDSVSAGQKLLEDKKNPGVYVNSPANGSISSINRGDKRRFLSIEIDCNDDVESLVFKTPENADETLKLIQDSGLWSSFKTRPFNRTPKIDALPKAIFVNACDTNPLSTDPFNIIKIDQDLFNLGLKTLASVFSIPIHCCYQNTNFDMSIESINYHQFTGPHPAGLTSTHIHNIYPVGKNRTVWSIGYQDCISLGYLLQKNKIRTSKIIALSGENVFEPKLLRTRIGSNISSLTAGKIEDNSRLISGSVIYGHTAESAMDFLGSFHNQVSVIPNEYEEPFMSWLLPGSKIHSKLNVFLSSFIKPKSFTFNTAMNGSDRAIVPISSYEEVMPLNIMTTQLLKALATYDLEMLIDLGVLELAEEDLALCSYVCPSKYDYSSLLTENLDLIYNEI